MSSKHPWRLAEISLNDVRSANFQAAVMTFGATEPHNLHLPYATDNIEVETIADRACARAWELGLGLFCFLKLGARVVLLPNIPFGNEQNLFQFPLAIHVEQQKSWGRARNFSALASCTSLILSLGPTPLFELSSGLKKAA